MLIRGFKELNNEIMRQALEKVNLINDPVIGCHVQKMLDFCSQLKETTTSSGASFARIFKYGPKPPIESK
jgi:hypothetical protein